MKDPAELWQTAVISGFVGFISAGISRIIEIWFKNRLDRKLQTEKNRFDLYKERLKLIQTLRQISNPYTGYETRSADQDAPIYLRETLGTAARFRSALEESRAYLPQSVAQQLADGWKGQAAPVFDELEFMLQSGPIVLNPEINQRISVLTQWIEESTYTIDRVIERDGNELLPAVESGQLGVGA